MKKHLPAITIALTLTTGAIGQKVKSADVPSPVNTLRPVSQPI